MPSMFFFFSNVPASTEIYTLSLHDALPISPATTSPARSSFNCATSTETRSAPTSPASCRRCARSEEHTSELQSQFHLVCRLLLEKKKQHTTTTPRTLHLKSTSPRGTTLEDD